MLNDRPDTFIWPADFACTIIDENVILPNHYNLKIYIEPTPPVTENFGIGFQKLKHIIFDCLNNSVLINKNNTLLPALSSMGTNIVHLPAEPYDFYVGATLFSKFISITKKYFTIYQISIDSAIGDRVQYTMSDPWESGLDFDGDFWWNHDTLDTGSNNTTTWDKLNLSEGPRFQPTVIKGGKSENQ